mmetsp:Transcript_53084/g.172579  ORF Transcript_53084/g.172579 Transcript_53084/m.172579 type:complete len:202 (+) Transcript_53084:294-899(+)
MSSGAPTDHGGTRGEERGRTHERRQRAAGGVVARGEHAQVPVHLVLLPMQQLSLALDLLQFSALGRVLSLQLEVLRQEDVCRLADLRLLARDAVPVCLGPLELLLEVDQLTLQLPPLVRKVLGDRVEDELPILVFALKDSMFLFDFEMLLLQDFQLLFQLILLRLLVLQLLLRSFVLRFEPPVRHLQVLQRIPRRLPLEPG